MRLVQYDNGGHVGVGVEVGQQVFYTGYSDMLSFIRDGDRALDRAREAARANGRPVQFDKLAAPITNPGKIFGSGPNYLGHGREDPDWVPANEPQWDFIKLASAITGPYDDIVIPPSDDVILRGPGSSARFAAEHGFAVDWEVELAVVIGSTAKNVRRAEAWDYVFGYTILNDVSARSVQFEFNQRDLGKNFDTFAPMGPCLVTSDELVSPEDTKLMTMVNNKMVQDGTTRDWIFPLRKLISALTHFMTLEPGDVVATGSPAGAGAFSKPQRFLKPGDTVTLEVQNIGQLENPVRNAA